MQSQTKTVAGALLAYGGLTDEQARLRGVRSLRKVVHALRRRGWRIATCRDYHEDTLHGQGRRHGHYVLEQAPGQPRVQPRLGL